jgi:hypothetical protein
MCGFEIHIFFEKNEKVGDSNLINEKMEEERQILIEQTYCDGGHSIGVLVDNKIYTRGITTQPMSKSKMPKEGKKFKIHPGYKNFIGSRCFKVSCNVSGWFEDLGWFNDEYFITETKVWLQTDEDGKTDSPEIHFTPCERELADALSTCLPIKTMIHEKIAQIAGILPPEIDFSQEPDPVFEVSVVRSSNASPGIFAGDRFLCEKLHLLHGNTGRLFENFVTSKFGCFEIGRTELISEIEKFEVAETTQEPVLFTSGMKRRTFLCSDGERLMLPKFWIEQMAIKLGYGIIDALVVSEDDREKPPLNFSSLCFSKSSWFTRENAESSKRAITFFKGDECWTKDGCNAYLVGKQDSFVKTQDGEFLQILADNQVSHLETHSVCCVEKNEMHETLVEFLNVDAIVDLVFEMTFDEFLEDTPFAGDKLFAA